MSEEPVDPMRSYEIQHTLGQGSFGKVKLCTHKYTKEKAAIKILKKENIKNLQRLKREI